MMKRITGDEIRQVRTTYGVSQKAFAAMLGLTSTGAGRLVRAWENGERPAPKLMTMAVEGVLSTGGFTNGTKKST